MSSFVPDVELFISNAYRAASQLGANMSYAAQSLENIRNEIARNDFLEAWSKIDEEIGRSDPDKLQPILINLRDQFKSAGFRRSILNLYTIFGRDSEKGWQSWLNSYIDALLAGRIEYCLILSQEQFPYPDRTKNTVEKLDHYTHLLYHRKADRAYPLYNLLLGLDLISDYSKASILYNAALVQLSVFLRLDKARSLLEQGKQLASDNIDIISGFGYYYLQVGDKTSAMECFEQALEKDPIRVNAYLGMGLYYELVNDREEAENWYREAITRFPGNPACYRSLWKLYSYPALFKEHEEEIILLAKVACNIDPNLEYDIYLDIGNIYSSLALYDDAFEWFEKAIRLDEKRAEGFTSMGYTYYEMGNITKSLELFEQGVKKTERDFLGYWSLAWWYENQANWYNALRWYMKSLDKRPEWEATIRSKMAEMRWKIGEYSEGDEEIIKALRIEPDNHAVMSKINEIAVEYYTNLDKSDDALRLYNKVLEIKGYTYKAQLHYDLANLFKIAKEWEKAMSELNEAYLVDKDTIRYYNIMGDIALEKGGENYNNNQMDLARSAYYEAIAYYDKVLKVDEKNLEALIGIGDASYNLSKFKDALLWYQKGLKADDGNVYKIYTFTRIGDCYYYLISFLDAIDAYDNALAMNPANLDALFGKYSCFYSMDRYDEAIDICDTIIELDPNNTSSFINKAITLDEQGKLKEAVDVYDKALQLDPSDANILNGKAWSLARLGHNRDALQCVNRSLEIDPNNIYAIHTKGFILYNLGEFKEAAKFFDRRTELDPTSPVGWYDGSRAKLKLNSIDESLNYLEKALRHGGQKYIQKIENDKDFDLLKSDSSFQQLISTYGKKTPSSS